MSNVEQMNFVIWAGQRDPKFTQSRKAYVTALWAWSFINSFPLPWGARA